jgi:hypothetical protein
VVVRIAVTMPGTKRKEGSSSSGQSIVSFFKKPATTATTSSANAPAATDPPTAATSPSSASDDVISITDEEQPEVDNAGNNRWPENVDVVEIVDSSPQVIRTVSSTTPQLDADSTVGEKEMSRSVHPMFLAKAKRVEKASPITIIGSITTPESAVVAAATKDEPTNECDLSADTDDSSNNLGDEFDSNHAATQSETIAENDAAQANVVDVQSDTDTPAVKSSEPETSGRPRRQAVLNTMQKQEQQKSVTADLDHELRFNGRIKPASAQEKKRKTDNSSDDDDFVEVKAKTKKTASIFLTKVLKHLFGQAVIIM